MTVIPNFLITGILAVLVGLAVGIWSVAFIQGKRGGVVLILLSVLMLLVGGGIFPPLIGIIGGAVGTRINAPPKGGRVNRAGRFLAGLWPWPLVAFLVWLLGQWVIGYFFNEFLQKNGVIIPVMVLGLLVLTVFTAFAYDNHQQAVSDRAH